MEVKIGDKIVQAENKNGIPVITAKAETICYPDGRKDVIVRVPCMKLKGKNK